MTPDTESHHLDDLLARSAPPSARADADLADAVASVIAQARADVPRRSAPRWTRRSIILVAAASVVLTGGGLAVATSGSPAWLPWNPDVFAHSSTVEWQVALPDGTVCVNRLTATDLSDADFAAAVAVLEDPGALIAADAGFTRKAFLTDFAVQGVDMEHLIDLAYAAAAAMDVDEGRGELEDGDLGLTPGSVDDEVFLRAHMRLVERGLVTRLADQGIDAEHRFTPDTACVVTP